MIRAGKGYVVSVHAWAGILERYIPVGCSSKWVTPDFIYKKKRLISHSQPQLGTINKKQTEDLVNKWIQDAIPVTVEEMKKDEAVKSGAECMFIEKYPDVVTVYTIGNVSKELCGGPHVKNTSELGKFKIKKEEASSAGVRRIKAILEK